ncbi:MAG: hypothetical protein M0T84_01940 [Betaproteobacteria bacterium]|nr:hypothetical protein [Betaproteobacteria bacterium]
MTPTPSDYGAAAVSAAVSPLLNHLLRQDAWARGKLAAHGGKTVRLDLGVVRLGLSVSQAGTLAPAPGAEADLVVRIPASVWAAVAGTGRDALAQAETSGDPEFARDLFVVATRLWWDPEEDLSRFFGDIAAHRLVAAATRLLAWQKARARDAVSTVIEYLTEERPVLPSWNAVDAFLRDVDGLRDDCSRLEQRFALAAGRLSPGPATVCP